MNLALFLKLHRACNFTSDIFVMWKNYEIQELMLSMSQEIIQDKKDMLEVHWTTILAVFISHQIMKYSLVAQTSESHEL